MLISCQPDASALPAGESAVDILFSLKAEAHEVSARPPLNLSLVIDRSGSMGGTPLKQAIKAGQKLLEHLEPQDVLSVAIYDDTVDTVVPPAPVTDKAALKAAIGGIRAGGCTNLHGGWKVGGDHVQKGRTKGQINRVLLLTDGQANVGETNPSKLIEEATARGEKGISTTTLGFGSYFQEDLLIGMARGSGGNFYYIQSLDEAAEVFDIEMQSLQSLVARSLSLRFQPAEGVRVAGLLNDYKASHLDGQTRVEVGDVYGQEGRLVGLSLTVQAGGAQVELGTLHWRYETEKDGQVQEHLGSAPLSVTVQADLGAPAPAERAVLSALATLRMARVKDEAVALADQGQHAQAGALLRAAIAHVRSKGLDDSFEVAEELEQLTHYATSLECQKFDTTTRKEMRDQAFQGQNRSRGDLKLRGAANSGSAHSLPTVQQADVSAGVLLGCRRESGKLRMNVISDGYHADWNVQFPRDIRVEGATYLVESVEEAGSGGFYRAIGAIKRVLKPGETVTSSGGSARPRSGKKTASAAPATAADLETTTVVDGVLVQCVKEGSKLRARVVSDGYDPDYNIRFPRSIRELGVLYVVEEVEEAAGGGSYVAYGKIKRLVQAP